MKKLILLLLCTATLGLASCKKDTIIQEPLSKTIIFDITPNQWILSNDGLTYSAEYNKIPEIDNFGLNVEGTLVYISYPNYTSYQQLPFVYDVDAFSYSAYVGGIAIDIQSSDFQQATPRKPTQTIRVKVVIVPSKDIS